MAEGETRRASADQLVTADAILTLAWLADYYRYAQVRGSDEGVASRTLEESRK